LNGQADTDAVWPVDKSSALRLGRRLVTEVPATRPGRRSFVDIRPQAVGADARAGQEGWSASSRIEHWEYDGEALDGFDYDKGAVELRSASAHDEAELAATIRMWGLRPDQFTYPWRTDDPR
jgi:hypothetical protein